MSRELINNVDYLQWLHAIKEKIRRSQIKATLAANSVLIQFYFELGQMIVEKQSRSKWGDKLIEQLARDLRKDFPGIGGFSQTNLKYCKRFYLFYTAGQGQSLEFEPISQQPVDQIPWGHNILIFTQAKSLEEAGFYLGETLKNNWSRDILALQIKSNLFKRQGRAITNFSTTLPEPQSDLANQTLKDPYLFDFVTLSKPYAERDIENQLVHHITKFLLELGKGFAFMGRQFHLEVAENDYYIDLLFYHVVLKAYVVVELKNTRFIPEYAGKMNFYLSAVDSLIKGADDNSSIGILLCRDKNNIEAEFALRDINKPMGISEFRLTEVLPDDLKSSLPTIEEIEQSLNLENDSENR